MTSLLDSFGYFLFVSYVPPCSQLLHSVVQSSLPSCHGGTAAAASSARSRHHQQAWQLFAPKTSSPSKRAALAVALKRRARLPRRVTGAGGGSAVSPAQMYRVTRGTPGGGAQRQQQQQQRFAPNDRESRGGASGGSSSIEQLQSPRSAELLTVYTSSSASSSTAAAAATPQLPSIAEDIGGGVVSQGEGEGARPALPLLTEEDLTQLRAGQRVQKQKREGGSGSGSVVVDVRADPDVVLGLLTKYEDYADMIDTVRQCEVFPIGETDDARKVRATCCVGYRYVARGVRQKHVFCLGAIILFPTFYLLLCMTSRSFPVSCDKCRGSTCVRWRCMWSR